MLFGVALVVFWNLSFWVVFSLLKLYERLSLWYYQMKLVCRVRQTCTTQVLHNSITLFLPILRENLEFRILPQIFIKMKFVHFILANAEGNHFRILPQNKKRGATRHSAAISQRKYFATKMNCQNCQKYNGSQKLLHSCA